jgi:hypothetical protein
VHSLARLLARTEEATSTGDIRVYLYNMEEFMGTYARMQTHQ